MNKDIILKKFQKYEPGFISEFKWKEFSVLIPLVKTDDGICILFEERASTLVNQPNEISFPGGAIERNEKPVDAAIRETEEELLVDKSKIEIFGASDKYIVPSGKMIYPFIGEVKDYKGTYSTQEVKNIFMVPYKELLTMGDEVYHNKVVVEIAKDFPVKDIPSGVDYRWGAGDHVVRFYRWKDKIIWGITARILKNAIQLTEEYGLFYLMEAR